MTHLHYGTLNRFRADLEADDLDSVITAPRESVGLSLVKERFEDLILEIFQEARQRYDKFIEVAAKKEQHKHESQRSFLSPTLVEEPVANALAQGWAEHGADADDSWFYVNMPTRENVGSVIERLYTEPRSHFNYSYVGSGKEDRLVKYDPEQSVFAINSDHPFVAAHIDDPRARLLLEDMLTAEAILETQLRDARVSPQVIGEVLEQRNRLLIGLARDHPYSHNAIAQALRDSADNERDLEFALVAAARSLGFTAKHISGAGEPDGIARFVTYPERTRILTLEAKSSTDVPSLSAIDFAGLARHVKAKEAGGCLLVAPSYPSVASEDSAAAVTAKQLRISCWTIDQLARVLEAAERRHINAEQVFELATSSFSPVEVGKAVHELLSDPNWNQQELGATIISALKQQEGILADMPRTISSIAQTVALDPRFTGIKLDDLRKAAGNLASSSQGALRFDGSTFTVLTAFPELERRTATATGKNGEPLRRSMLREDIRTNGSDEY